MAERSAGKAGGNRFPSASSGRVVFNRTLFGRTLFCFYILLLVWAPLPLGSNRAWSWAVLEVWVFLLGTCALLSWAINPRAWPGFASGGGSGGISALAIGLLVLWLGYLGLQMLELPLPLLERLAPANASWWPGLPTAADAGVGRLAASLESARSGWLKQCAYTVAFCLTLALVDSGRRLRIVIYAMLATATLEAVYGLSALFMHDGFPFWRPTWFGHHWATGTFINKNHYAANLSFGIALSVGLCLDFVSRRPLRSRSGGPGAALARLSGALLEPGYLRFGLLLVLLTAFFFSQSRGAFLGLVIAGLGLLVFGACWQKSRRSARDAGRAAPAETRLLPWLLVTGLAAAVWLRGSGLFTRLSPSELADPGRLYTWRQALVMWRDHWLFGTGNDSFRYVFTRYRVPELDGRVYDYAHNDHLQLLVEQGVIGAVLFYSVFGLCWCAIMTAYCRSGGGAGERGLVLGILIAVSAFFLHALVDFNFHIPGNALWFYVLLALGLVCSTRQGRRIKVATAARGGNTSLEWSDNES